MNLKLTRQIRTAKSTIGTLEVNGENFCYILEDHDRGLTADTCDKKIPGQTCIPAGTYEVVMSWSNRFKKYMPLLLNVPCFTGIRVHAGNVAADSEGCLLTGMKAGVDIVHDSRRAFSALVRRIRAVEKTEKIVIDVC